MPQFEYQGRTAEGEQATGKIEAENNEAAANQLLMRGITPIKLTQVKVEQELSLAAIEEKLGIVKVPIEELIMFSRQMYRLTKAGVSILASLGRLSETTRCRALSKTLQAVSTTISSGQTLGEALRLHPKVFSALYVSIIEVGESTGRMDKAFLQITGYLQLESKTIKRVKAALRYPTFVVISILVALIVINVFVLPAFANMFEKFQAELPLPTRVLLGTSNFIMAYGHFILMGIVGAVIWFLRWIQTKKGRLLWDRAKLHIFIVGPILKKIILSRFTRSFSMIMEAGVPILKGINLSAWAVGNAYIAQEILKMRTGIEKGESLSRVATHSGLFTPLVLQMLEVGEESGSLGPMLNEVAEYYEAEVDYALDGLSASMEPVLLTIIAIMVLALALGIFLPMWEMVSAVKGG